MIKTCLYLFFHSFKPQKMVQVNWEYTVVLLFQMHRQSCKTVRLTYLVKCWQLKTSIERNPHKLWLVTMSNKIANFKGWPFWSFVNLATAKKICIWQWFRAEAGNWRATAFSLAHESIQKQSLNLKFPPD